MGQNSHDHLLTAKQGVANELASSQGDGSVGVRHFRDCLTMDVSKV